MDNHGRCTLSLPYKYTLARLPIILGYLLAVNVEFPGTAVFVDVEQISPDYNRVTVEVLEALNVWRRFLTMFEIPY